MQIKKFEEKYREQVQNVCTLTGPAQAVYDKKVREYIVNMYCNYYLDFESENCFVLVNDDDEAVGYILCCENIGKYIKKFPSYLPAIFKNAGKDFVEAMGEFLGTVIFGIKYPAHMHIDILHKYTGSGWGTELLETLMIHLKNKNVKSVMLIVGSFNDKAIRFYERNKFNKIISIFGGVIMGRNLDI